MKKFLPVDAEAEEEIAHAIDRHENERKGLGLEFWTEPSDAMDTLDEPGPECGPVIGLPPELGVVPAVPRPSLTAQSPQVGGQHSFHEDAFGEDVQASLR